MPSYQLYCDPFPHQTLRDSTASGGYSAGIIDPTACYASILSGEYNAVCAQTASGYAYNTISGGYKNCLLNCSRTMNIGGGDRNTASGYGSGIFSGGSNTASGSIFSVIGGGQANTLSGTSSGIFSGASNMVNAVASVIAGGNANKINNGAVNAFIGAGMCNCIFSCAVYSGTFSGYLNSNHSQCYSFIGGGAYNTLSAVGSIDGCYSTIGGGCANYMAQNVCFGFIGGGACNHVQENCYSTVSGGYCNFIAIGGTDYSAILGGYKNCVLHAYAGAFGCNVVTVCGCAFHANTFIAQNMCCVGAAVVTAPSYPRGTLYYKCCAMGCQCPVFIA